MYQDAGLSLVNWHLSVFVTAQFHNGLRRFKLLEIKWPVIRVIVDVHKKVLFAVAIPTRTNDKAGRFPYRMNIHIRQRRRYKDEK